MNFFEQQFFPLINDFVTKSFYSYRKNLYKNANGNILEVGIGTGNQSHLYPQSVTSIHGIDPNSGMLKKAKLINDPRLKLTLGKCESLPFENNTFDCVIIFLVLCSVTDIDKSITEIKRVLKPKGKLIFFEHIAPVEGSLHRKLLEKIDPYWQIPACGCHLTRDTGIILENRGFKVEYQKFKKRPSRIIPIIKGIAINF